MANLRDGNVPLYLDGHEINIGGDIILEVNDLRIVWEDSTIELFRSIFFMGEEAKNSFKLKILRVGKVQEVMLRFPNE